ncbi:MAG: hypothetical protein ACR2PS_12735 [Pseudomonadales bacterium]
MKLKFKNTTRTLLLGFVLTAALVWSSIYRFDVEPAEILGFAGYSVLLVLLLLAAAALTAGLITLLRRWLK